MGLARSTFYDVAPVPLEPAELVARIGAICDEFDGSVGIAVGGRTAFARDGSRTTYLFTDFSRIAIVPSRRSNHDGSECRSFQIS